MISSAPPKRAITALPRPSGSAWRRQATSISTNIPAGIRFATRPITMRAKPGWMPKASGLARTALQSNGWRRRAISSSFPNIEFSDRVLIGEIYLPIERLVAYYGRDLQGLHLPLLSTSWRAPLVPRVIDED